MTRLNVEYFDGKGASKIVDSNCALTNYGLVAFIPNYRVSNKGIIRDIPLEIRIEDDVGHSATSFLWGM